MGRASASEFASHLSIRLAHLHRDARLSRVAKRSAAAARFNRSPGVTPFIATHRHHRTLATIVSL